ncbi:hypothetical protein FHW67_003145 [Herbaspirillum sp. Sphag1AN]|nr:hypothetical protein [Herbaspirillum sp. Sphag1AN]MBB3247036.1 hypothetical protein [Herbaspirillum sp. Sphag64]
MLRIEYGEVLKNADSARYAAKPDRRLTRRLPLRQLAGNHVRYLHRHTSLSTTDLYQQLEREANEDAETEDQAVPAIGIVLADQLMRLSIVSAGLLGDEARRQVGWLNESETTDATV